MKKTLAVLGAIDRYNYGDLLFPIIIEHALADCRALFEFKFYGLTDSDLRCYGAKKTSSIRKLFHGHSMEKGSVLMIAGGDVLGMNWAPTHVCFLSHFQYILFDLMFKVFGKGLRLGILINRLLAIRYGARGVLLPWIVPKTSKTAKAKIIYNTVGGSHLSFLVPKYREYLRQHLNHADYISVRDHHTRRRLIQMGVTKEIHCAPDSAILMSRYFPVESLEDKAAATFVRDMSKY